MRISALQRFQAPTPRLVVAQRVLDKDGGRGAAVERGGDRRGAGGAGGAGRRESGIYLLDTIGPDESALRKSHTFQQGDARQDEIFVVVAGELRARREHDAGLPAKWNAPLRYLGTGTSSPAA